MEKLEDNNILRFVNISKKKSAIVANFKMKGLRRGVTYSATLSVDITALNIDLDKPLEEIISLSAKEAIKQFTQAEVLFEGFQTL